MSLLLAFQAPAAPTPFAQNEWPVPPGARFAIELRSWAQGPDVPPFVQSPFVMRDWPNPRGPAGALIQQQTLDLLLSTLFRPPFALKDWPNPRVPAGVQNWSAQSLLQFTLGGVQAPFNQDEWPVPQGARRDVPPLLVNLQQTTLAPAVYIFRDPLVTRYEQRSYHAVLVFPPTNRLLFQAPAAAPFAQDDWPNPHGPLWVGYIPTHHARILVPIAQAPFALFDWPNPSGAAYPISLRTFLESLDLNLYGQDQFFGPPGMGPVYQYPNPRGPQRAIDLLTLLNTLALTLPEPAPDLRRLLRMRLGVGL